MVELKHYRKIYVKIILKKNTVYSSSSRGLQALSGVVSALLFDHWGVMKLSVFDED